MKFESVLIPLSLILSAQSMPIWDTIIDSFYKRDSLLEVYTVKLLRREDVLNSSVGGNRSNSTNGTAGATGTVEATSIKIYGFSQNFTVLYNDAVSLTETDISALLPNSTSNSSSQEEPSGSSSPSLKDVLEESFPNVTLAYELLNYTDYSNFSSVNAVQLYKGISEESKSYEAFVVLPPSNQVQSTAFFLETVLPLNVTSKIIVIPDINSDNLVSGGYQNLYDAVLIASTNSTLEDLRTFVVEDDYIHSGFYGVDEIGYINDEVVEWFYENVEPLNVSSRLDGPTLPEQFSQANVKILPLVATLELSGDNLALAGALVQSNIQGVVLTTDALDTTSPSLGNTVKNITLPIVIVADSINSDDVPEGTISAGILDTQRAKVLLQAGLAAGYDKNQLKQLFSSVYGG